MYKFEIESALRKYPCTRPIFKGVFSRDELERVVLRKNQLIIANTAVKPLPGHWIVFFQSDHLEFFDSLAANPSKYGLEFVFFIRNNAPERGLKINPRPIQHPSSTACGWFCLYFAMMRCHHVSMDNILKRFSSNTALNDTLVIRAVKRKLVKY